MIKIEISNFQAIRHVAFMVDGFSTILGRSNIGKSAIVRAVQDALTGAVGTDSVRHDHESCARILKDAKKCKCFSRVMIETPTLTFTWDKGDQVNQYTVVKDGKTNIFEGLERGTPEFLLPDFDLVKVGDSNELIQAPDQFEPIFLLNKSGPAVADVLSDVARLDQINAAIGAVNKDRKEAVSKRKIREEDVVGIERDLKTYTGLDEVQTSTLESALKKAQTTEFDIAKIEGHLSKWGALTLAVADLERATAFPLPSNETLTKSFADFVQVYGFISKIAEKVPLVQKLAGVELVELPIQSHEEKLQEIVLCDNYLTRLGLMEKAVEHLDGLADLSLDLDLPSADKLLQVDHIISRIKACLDAQKTLNDALSKADKELEATIQALQEEGVCPTCTQPFDSNHRTLHLEAS